MRRIKMDSERKIRLSITIAPDLNEIIENISLNKSSYIEHAMLEYFNKCGLDTKKIKL
jgi:hypothetical protein